MSRARLVPAWVRGTTLVIALLNVAYGVFGYLSPSVLFPASAPAPLDPHLIAHASREFSSRNLAIGVALLIVSRVGVPESIAIVTIVRALIELQTIAIAVAEGAVRAGSLVLPIVLLAIEIAIVRTLVQVIRSAELEPRRQS